MTRTQAIAKVVQSVVAVPLSVLVIKLADGNFILTFFALAGVLLGTDLLRDLALGLLARAKQARTGDTAR